MQVLVKSPSKAIIRILTIALFISTWGGAQTGHTVIPKDGFVPDQETAMRIAEAVWIPIYGVEQIKQEKPFVTELKNGVWIVSGTLHGDPGAIPKGGVATIEISKADGRVLRVSHGK
jgi:hypothetical protein